MGRFTVDADLLVYEPGVFVELPVAGQKRARVEDAVVTGVEVSSGTGGLAGLMAGEVATVWSREADKGSWPIEAVVDDGRLRLASAPVGLGASSGLVLEVRSFQRQAEAVHDELLRCLGVDPEDVAGAFDEAAIVSVGVMRRLEAMGVLAMAYRGAVGVGGSDAGVAAKAEAWERRYAAARRGARVLIDLDGDGRADVWRMPGVGRLVRS